MQVVSCCLTTTALSPVKRARTCAVVAQMSAQSWSLRMHARRSATESSDRQASAQVVQVVAQSLSA